ncbi:aminoacyl tRNA synthase complex-interacting multifunctional protein 1-like isoform X2 [Micropterus salmoides]|nr:aminoacyl tRNA synthase complex-interacting multifunctional protein 1-like isoform X2 [Micropterus salmoides]
MEYFKTHAMLAREKALLQASVRDQKKLLVENSKLKKDIEQLKNQLQEKQRRRIAKALFSTPSPTRSPAPTTQPPSTAGASAAVPTNPPPPSSSFSHDRRERQSRRKRGERKARPTCDLLSLGVEPQVDVSRLDLRVGRILGVRHHPLAEELSVQEVDVGKAPPELSSANWERKQT